MLGEQVRGGNPQQATTSSGLAHLEDGSVLQPEQLNGSSGKPQSTRSEGQAGGRTHEQLVPELLAQLGNVQRDGGRRDAEVRACVLDRTASDHGDEGA
jgi:hypothetical protein